MDWADDVAYSVRVEDGPAGGAPSPEEPTRPFRQAGGIRRPPHHYCAPEWAVTAPARGGLRRFCGLDCWQFSFDGGPASLVSAKNLTSELVGSLCQAPRTEPRRGGPRPAQPLDRNVVVPAASGLNALGSRRSPRTNV